MNDNVDYSSKGAFEFFAIVFLVAVVGIGFHFYQSLGDGGGFFNVAIAANESPPAPQASDQGEYKKLITANKQLQDQNAALKAQLAKHDSEKTSVMNQVRTSVKAFDDYRKESVTRIEKLSNDVRDLTNENSKLKSQAAEVQTADISSKADWSKERSELKNQVAVYKETIELLRQEIAAKEDRKVLAEASKLHYNVGNFYFRNGQYKNAVQEYAKSLLYRPNDADAHYNLAVVSDEYLGDRRTALKHYKRYLALNPNGDNSSKIENRILDLELYETVLVPDKDTEGSAQFRWLDTTQTPDTTRFYSR